MSTQEFYIRAPTDAEARGPFTFDQLSSLVDAGQVNTDTLYYDASVEQWVEVSSNDQLTASLFPEKRKLKIKPKEKITTLNVKKEGDAPITVEQMLAAAEGRTDDTRSKRDPTIAMARAASLAMQVGAVALLISAAALTVPHLDVVMAGNYGKILAEPWLLFGLADAFLAMMLLLQASSFFPLVRFRAALGFGFFGFLFWSFGEPATAGAVMAGSAGIYLATVCLNFTTLAAALLLGLGGMAGFAYLMLA